MDIQSLYILLLKMYTFRYTKSKFSSWVFKILRSWVGSIIRCWYWFKQVRSFESHLGLRIKVVPSSVRVRRRHTTFVTLKGILIGIVIFNKLQYSYLHSKVTIEYTQIHSRQVCEMNVLYSTVLYVATENHNQRF